LLAADDGRGVSLLTVNRTTGALRYASTWVGSEAMSPDASDSSDAMSFNPRGNLLALMVRDEADAPYRFAVAILSVKQRTRTLAPVAQHTFAEGAGDLAFSPDGRLLGVSGAAGEDVAMLRVNQTTGALDRVHGSPFGTGGSGSPGSLAFSPDGRLLAVATPDDQDFSLFSVSKRNGTLRRVPGSPFSLGQGVDVVVANSVAFSPRGNLLAYGGGDISPNDPQNLDGDQKVAIFCADPDHDRDCDSL
jgi:WD40 repeat protein